MAINKTINKSTKSHGAMRNCMEYVLKESKIGSGLVMVTGPFDSPVIDYDSVYQSFLTEKRIWNKHSGRMYAHNIISWHKDEDISLEEVFDFGVEFASNWFEGFQTLIAVHQDRDHVHVHLVTNTVSYEDGRKLHNTRKDLERMKQLTNEMCLERGLSVALKGKNFHGEDLEEPSDYEMNLFNFYTIVYEKLKVLLQSGFTLDEGQLRLPISDFDETLREGLINCLAHADYIQAYPSTKIEVFDGWFRFVNPGKMLISTRQFRIRGDSRPRNGIIMKLFRLLGASERQGFGGPLIYKTAVSNDYRNPEILTDIEKTELRVWNIDLADSYPELTEEEKSTLRHIIKQVEPLSVNQIRTKLDISEYRMRKIVTTLEEKNLIQKIGNGPSTRYEVVKESTEFLTQMQMALENIKVQEQ